MRSGCGRHSSNRCWTLAQPRPCRAPGAGHRRLPRASCWSRRILARLASPPRPPGKRAWPSGRETLADAVRVVVAHGTLQGGPVPEGETDAYPFTPSPTSNRLGRTTWPWDIFTGFIPPGATATSAQKGCGYSGTHEPDQFGGEAGYAILATLNAGQPTRLKRIKVGRRQWRRVGLAGPADLGQSRTVAGRSYGQRHSAALCHSLGSSAPGGWASADAHRLYGLESALHALGAQVERRGDIRAQVDVQGWIWPGCRPGR